MPNIATERNAAIVDAAVAFTNYNTKLANLAIDWRSNTKEQSRIDDVTKAANLLTDILIRCDVEVDIPIDFDSIE